MPYHNCKMSSFKSYLKVWVSQNHVTNLSKGNDQFDLCKEIKKRHMEKLKFHLLIVMTSCVDKTSKHSIFCILRKFSIFELI